MQASIFTCSGCGTKLKVQAVPGKRVKCPKCGKISPLGASPAHSGASPAHSAGPSVRAAVPKARAPTARPAPAPPPTPSTQPDEPVFTLDDIVGNEAGSEPAADAPVEDSPRPVSSGRGRGRSQKGGGDSKKTWILIGGGSVAALLLVGLLLFFLLRGGNKPKSQPVVEAPPAVVAPQPPPPVPSQGWDLAYLPASATAVVGVRPAAILNSTLTKELLGSIGPFGQGALQAAEQQLGVSLNALDQIVAAGIIKLGDPPGFDFVTVIHTSSPVDRVKFMQSQGPATEASFQGKSYHKVKAQGPPSAAPGAPGFGPPPNPTSGTGGLPANPPGLPAPNVGGAAPTPGQTPPSTQIPAGGNQPPSGLPFAAGFAPSEVAIWFADERTVVVGTEPLVQAAITQGPTSPTLAPQVSETLTALGSSVQLAFVTKVDVIKEFAEMFPIGIPGAAAGPPGQDVPAGFDKLQVVGLSLNLSQQVEVGLIGHCGSDAAAATQVRTAIAELIQQAQTAVGAERQQLESQPGTSPGQGPPPPAQVRDAQLKSITAVETMLKEVKNEATGAQVRVRASMPSATVSTLFKMAMSMSNGPAGPPGAPPRPAFPSQPPPGSPPVVRPAGPPGAQPGAAGPPPGGTPK